MNIMNISEIGRLKEATTPKTNQNVAGPITLKVTMPLPQYNNNAELKNAFENSSGSLQVINTGTRAGTALSRLSTLLGSDKYRYYNAQFESTSKTTKKIPCILVYIEKTKESTISFDAEFSSLNEGLDFLEKLAAHSKVPLNANIALEAFTLSDKKAKDLSTMLNASPSRASRDENDLPVSSPTSPVRTATPPQAPVASTPPPPPPMPKAGIVTKAPTAAAGNVPPPPPPPGAGPRRAPLATATDATGSPAATPKKLKAPAGPALVFNEQAAQRMAALRKAADDSAKESVSTGETAKAAAKAAAEAVALRDRPVLTPEQMEANKAAYEKQKAAAAKAKEGQGNMMKEMAEALAKRKPQPK